MIKGLMHLHLDIKVEVLFGRVSSRPCSNQMKRGGFEHYQSIFSGRPRSVNRVINSFNISRSIVNETPASKVHRQSSCFCLKMIKLILMAEIWPYRTTWLLQIAEDAIQEEDLQIELDSLSKIKYKAPTMKHYSDTYGLTTKEVLLKICGEKNSPMEVIMPKLSLFDVYIKVVKVLMFSPESSNAEMSRDDDPQLFESLLATCVEDDLLMLEDIIPLDNIARFSNAQTLRPFIFNLHTHMMEKAAGYLEEIAIYTSGGGNDVQDGNENTSSSTSSQVRVSFQKKTDVNDEIRHRKWLQG